MLPKSQTSQVLHLEIRAIPGAAKTQLVGWYGSAMKVRVAAPPEDNAANKALMQWLRKTLQAESVELVAGQSARNKVLKLSFAGGAPTAQAAYDLLLAAA